MTRTRELAKIKEDFSPERVRAIIHGSFELSQNKPYPQQDLLAWATTKHPHLLKPLRKELTDPNSPLIKIIQHKVRNGDHAEISASEQSIWMQVSRNDDIFKGRENGLMSAELYMVSPISILIRQDLRYLRQDKGRKRNVSGEDTIIWKSYFIEHVLLGIEYKGDKIWQQFLSECRDIFFSDGKTKLSKMIIERNAGFLWALIDRYNQLLAEGKYSNKDPRCVPIDATTVPFLAPYRQRFEDFLKQYPDYFDKLD